MKSLYTIVGLLLVIVGCSGRDVRTRYTINLKNESSQNLKIRGSVNAPSGDESQCMSGESDSLAVPSKSEGSLSVSIKCTIEKGAHLSGSINTSLLSEDFSSRFKLFRVDILPRLVAIDMNRIRWSYADKIVPLARENKDYTQPLPYAPAVVKNFRASDFNAGDNWYAAGANVNKFYLVVDKDVEEVSLLIDKDLVTPYKVCDACGLATLDGPLEDGHYKVKTRAESPGGISLNTEYGATLDFNVVCTDTECTLN